MFTSIRSVVRNGSMKKFGLGVLTALAVSCVAAKSATAAAPFSYPVVQSHRLSATDILNVSISTVSTARRSPMYAAHDLTGRAIVQLNGARGELHSRRARDLVESSLGNLAEFQRCSQLGYLATAQDQISDALRAEQHAHAGGERHHTGYTSGGGYVGPRVVAPPVVVAPLPVPRPAPGLSIGGRWGHVSVRL